MTRVLASSRNHSRQAVSRAKIQARTRSSPRFRGTASSTSTVKEAPVVGDKVPTTGIFASKTRLQDGTSRTIMGLLDESEGGIVVWTFKPRAEDEACDFASEIITSSYAAPGANMTLYGLTTSSVTTNASLQNRRNEIDRDLLSDPGGKLLRAMGYIDTKGGVKRGAFVISKDGTLLLRRAGGGMFHVADAVYRALKAVVKAKVRAGGVKIPY